MVCGSLLTSGALGPMILALGAGRRFAHCCSSSILNTKASEAIGKELCATKASFLPVWPSGEMQRGFGTWYCVSRRCTVGVEAMPWCWGLALWGS